MLHSAMSSIKFKIEKFAGDSNFGLCNIEIKDLHVYQGLEDALKIMSKLLKNPSDKRKIRHCQEGTYHNSSFPR
jgi:hypothetical protein